MIKLLETFSGYGGASFALKMAGIPFECVGYSEIDKYAIECYNKNFPGVRNFGSMRDINPNDLPDFDLLTGGFPCQSFSAAGHGLGELDARGTLFYEIIRIAEVKKPKYMLLENVKGLTFKKHKAALDKIISEIERIGYYVNRCVLNSKNFGIPQNRERIWFVCFRNDVLRHDFRFPQGEELTTFVKDLLEPSVDYKFLLSEKQKKRIEENIRHRNCMLIEGNVSSTLAARDYKDGGKRITRVQKDNLVMENTIFRRLTPKECFRLMGFTKDEINIEGLSDTQKYKLAGNGWCMRPASDILKEMLNGEIQ